VLIAEGIEALGLAYAYDADDDGELDRSGGNVIWAVDSDNDNRLDLILGGGAVNIDPDDIRAVRIWLLGRTRGPVMNRDLTNRPDYVVAERVVPDDDNYDRRLLTATIILRNLGL
jgi:type IV pilus assembly protein PilW